MNFFDYFLLIIATFGNLPYQLNTVSNLELPQYMGNWHHIYTNKITEMLVGENISCLSTQYKIMDEPFQDKFSINYQGNLNDTIISTNGMGYTKNISEPGTISVDLLSEGISFDYFILDNGPIVDEQYQYSIITDEYGIFLYVLIRELSEFTKYQKDIDQVLENYNFTDYFRRPIILDHTNC